MTITEVIGEIGQVKKTELFSSRPSENRKAIERATEEHAMKLWDDLVKQQDFQPTTPNGTSYLRWLDTELTAIAITDTRSGTTKIYRTEKA